MASCYDLRVNDRTTDRRALDKAEVCGCLLVQSLPHRLASTEHQAVLAWDTAKLLKVVLDQVLEA
jgi:hypothetical protein